MIVLAQRWQCHSKAAVETPFVHIHDRCRMPVLAEQLSDAGVSATSQLLGCLHAHTVEHFCFAQVSKDM
jgi:hypothetical protein